MHSTNFIINYFNYNYIALLYILKLNVLGHRGESTKGEDWGSGQKEILGSLRFDCWPILLSHSKGKLLIRKIVQLS